MAPRIAPRFLRLFAPRRLVRVLCLGVALVLIAAAVNAIGIGIAGDVHGWERWLTDHRGYFLTWRLVLYAATGYGWCRMRKRLMQREPNARSGLRRAEVAAVTVIFALELVTFLRA